MSVVYACFNKASTQVEAVGGYAEHHEVADLGDVLAEIKRQMDDKTGPAFRECPMTGQLVTTTGWPECYPRLP